MHYALALLPATHLPTVSLHTRTNTSTPHTHTHTHGLVQLAETLGSYFSHKSYMSMNVHTCVRARTHTHTHSLTQTGLVPLAVTLVLISHTVFTKYTCTHTYDTHIHGHTYTHTHKHTHTQTGLVPLAVILVLISHTVFTKYTCTCLCTHT